MVDYVMVQANCENKRMVKDSVGIASYAMDFISANALLFRKMV